MTLTINYKNGNTLTQSINYIHTEDNKLYFTVDKRIHPTVEVPTEVPFENIKSFSVEV